MIEENNSRLVPRLSASVAKADSGRERLLAGIVGDTLTLAKDGSPAQQPQKKPLRFVLMDDVQTVLAMLEAVLRPCYEDATILTFGNAESAYQELMREEPDLFLTDVFHPAPDGFELLRRLGNSKVKYPIFVISAVAKEEDVLLHAPLRLDVTFLAKPFSADKFLKAVATRLRCRPEIKSDE